MASAKRLKAAAKPVAQPAGLEHSGPVFDRAVRLASTLFDGDEAQISLLSDATAWRSHQPYGEMPAEAPLSRLVLAEDRVVWVEDARKDARFRDRPMIKGPPHLRFFAGAPIRLEDGARVGALLVGGPKPRMFDAALAERLQDLADFVADEWIRIRARQAREERELTLSVFNEVVLNAPMSMVVTDAAMNVLSASKRWISMLSLEDEPFVGLPLFAVRSGFFNTWREELARCLAGETVKADRLRVEFPDGPRWFEVEVMPWVAPTGETGGLIITSHEITELVLAMENAERSQERLTLALQIADLHVWEMDYVRGELIKAGAEDTFFTEPKSYAQLLDDIWCTIDPRDLPAVQAQWDKHLADGSPYRPEYRVVRSDGREVWTAGAVKLILGRDGQPARLVGALQDITDRKAQERALVQAKEEAEAANRAKSVFLATMSHEIRTPLNGVLGMAQAMAMGDLTDLQRERLDVIRQSGEGLLHILNDVLDLSKIEAGKLVLEEAEFDIADLAKGAHATFAAVAEAKGVGFRLNVTPAARGIYLGDSVRVRQILYNLVSNALKFTDAGEVSVTVSRPRGILKISVKDTGIGIAPEKLGNLFQKFEQADASMTRRYGGTGLGLAICRDLAQLMGGAIGASSAPGEGSTFWATLKAPQRLEAMGARAPKPAAAPARTARPLRVLAAEDNEMNQIVLKTLLQQVGVEPVLVRTGKEAVAAWEKADWDVILMDVQMPEMDGPSATAIIRTREAAEGRARTPIVALTANAMDHHLREYQDVGMDGFVAKPIEAARLFAAVQDAAAMRRPRRRRKAA